MFRRMLNIPANMWVGWIIPIVLLLLIGLSIYMIISNNNHIKQDRSNPALDKLNERYASGEITEEEYLKIKDNLSRNR